VGCADVVWGMLMRCALWGIARLCLRLYFDPLCYTGMGRRRVGEPQGHIGATSISKS
jgi:hypothetical protein